MKKITALLAMAVLTALPLTFTSCDDDDDYYWWDDYRDGGYYWNDDYYNRSDGNQGSTIVDEAQVLNGEWDGQMIYTNGSDGSVDQFYANMTFVQNSTYATKGTGTEYDYYLNADGSVGENQTLKFTWYIASNGDIYVKYASGSTFVMDINASQHGIYLDEQSGVFQGYMIGTNNSDLIQFDFTRQTSGAKASVGTRTVQPTVTTFGADLIGGITTKPTVGNRHFPTR